MNHHFGLVFVCRGRHLTRFGGPGIYLTRFTETPTRAQFDSPIPRVPTP